MTVKYTKEMHVQPARKEVEKYRLEKKWSKDENLLPPWRSTYNLDS